MSAAVSGVCVFGLGLWMSTDDSPNCWMQGPRCFHVPLQLAKGDVKVGKPCNLLQQGGSVTKRPWLAHWGSKQGLFMARHLARSNLS